MGLYNVIISPKALSQLDDYISYIQYTLLSEQAAESVWQDAIDTKEILSKTAGSIKICENKILGELGYHSIRFRKHRYIMLFRIEGTDVFVDAIYHQLQDYENIFINDLKNI